MAEITERWRKMPEIYGYEDRSRKLRIGQRTWDIPVLFLDQDGIDRIRLGYLCIACIEPHEVPYPEFCALDTCRFPMRRFQDEVFEHLYVGEISYGPQTTLSDEWEIAKDTVARQRHRKGTTIWVPGDQI